MTRTLLITGATGTVSSALIDVLKDTDVQLRGLTRSETKAETLVAQGIHAVIGSLDEPRTLPAAFDGVDDLWLLTPNGARATENTVNAIWAAQHSSVRRIVRLSVVGAALDALMRSGRLHALSDRAVEQSGLAWTILRPHWFMQNLLNEAADIAELGSFGLNMGTGRIGMIDIRDIAELAVKVLTGSPDVHHAKVYTPTGPESISFADVANALGGGRDIPTRYLPISDAEAQTRLLAFGTPPWIVEMLSEYAKAYAAGWGDFVTSDFEEVTGRQPRSIADFAKDHAADFANRAGSTRG